MLKRKRPLKRNEIIKQFLDFPFINSIIDYDHYTFKGKLDATLNLSSDNIISACVKNNLLALGLVDGQIHIWDLKSQTLIRKLISHISSVSCLCFSGDLLISGSDDATVRIWNKNYSNITSFYDNCKISCLTVLSDKLFFASSNRIKTVDLKKFSIISDEIIDQNQITNILTHDDILVTFSINGVKYWNVTEKFLTRNHIAEFSNRYIHDKLILKCLETPIFINPDLKIDDTIILALKLNDERLLTTSTDNTLKIWDEDRSQNILYANNISHLLLLDTGKVLIIYEGDKIQVWR